MKLLRIPAFVAFVTIMLLPVIGAETGASRTLRDIDPLPTAGKISANLPNVEGAVHSVGKIGLAVTNQGNFGTGFIGNFVDEVTGQPAPSCQYPYPSRLEYLFAGAFWIGAVVGRDTLVSVGADGWYGTREMWPDPITGYADQGLVIRRSISNGDSGAVSEQDVVCLYTDTLTSPSLVTIDPRDGRPHMPLNIEVVQRSYAWSYSYAADFVLFDYAIKNIGRKKLNQVYMGLYVDGDVQTMGSAAGFADDICGFKREIASPFGCGFVDTIDIAWIADNDGRDKVEDICPFSEGGSLTSVTGSRVVRTPSDSLKYSFNWWVSNGDPSLDFGPRKAGTPEDPFRDFGGFLGTPEGDLNKYYIMRHEEFDYDQLFSAQDHTAEGWLPPGPQAADFADGFDTRYLLSFGPFDVSPGEVLPISFAYVAGANFHTNCDAFKNIFNPQFPDAYNNYLNFEEFGKNALWASWIYDNPGFDTDGDGDKGKYRICVYDSTVTIDTTGDPPVIDTTVTYLKADTMYYEGDGVPDFLGASPPPPPVLRVYPSVNKFNEGELRVRWNGLRSETEKDVFSNRVDFEGYRVYQSLSPKGTDFVMVNSFDKDDYNKYIWNRDRGIYELKDAPYTRDSLKTMYGESFDPMRFNRDNPFYWIDSAFYFNPQDWNQSNLTDTNSIHKLYPDASYPSTLNPDTAKIHFPEELTEEGYFKYFEYEYSLKHMLPSQLNYVAVTAFDYGSPGSGLESLESPPSANMVAEYPQNQTSVVESKGLNVVVYPNPYRIDARYRSIEGGGFEGRDPNQESLSDERVRRIHFANLPHKCKIRIFTVDGDLVRVIDHNYAPDSPRSMHDEWDLITRNTQAIVSGIYYYSVESESGNQIGKIVIIM